MTEAIEQEALALFANDLAAFLVGAIAKLDALGAGSGIAEKKPRTRKSVANPTGNGAEEHPVSASVSSPAFSVRVPSSSASALLPSASAADAHQATPGG